MISFKLIAYHQDRYLIHHKKVVQDDHGNTIRDWSQYLVIYHSKFPVVQEHSKWIVNSAEHWVSTGQEIYASGRLTLAHWNFMKFKFSIL